MTTKHQLIPVSEVLFIVKLASLFYNLVSVRKQGFCPPLKISGSTFTMRNNYLLRRMFGFLSVTLAELGGYLICQEDYQQGTVIYTENGTTD